MTTTITRRWRLLVLAAATVALVAGSVLGGAQAAGAAVLPDDDPWAVSDLDVVKGGVYTRASLLANLDLFRPYGANENFVYYSDETTIYPDYSDYPNSPDPRRWACMKQNPGSYYEAGRWWTPIYLYFYPGGYFRAWQSGYDSFVAKACGNHTRWITNPKPPYISGLKYEDKNNNGDRDLGEPVIPGWQIYLWKDGVSIASTQTAADGTFKFLLDATQGFTPGLYALSEEMPSGWYGTETPGFITVVAGAGSANKEYGGNEFGNYRQVCGYPRTIGYWKNWDNHYTDEQMEVFVARVRTYSSIFKDLDIDDVKGIMKDGDNNAEMTEKAETQYLAFLLNLACGNTAGSPMLNIAEIKGWQTVAPSADSQGNVTLAQLTADMKAAFGKQWTYKQWEAIKNILDSFNNGWLD